MAVCVEAIPDRVGGQIAALYSPFAFHGEYNLSRLLKLQYTIFSEPKETNESWVVSFEIEQVFRSFYFDLKKHLHIIALIPQ